MKAIANHSAVYHTGYEYPVTAAGGSEYPPRSFGNLRQYFSDSNNSRYFYHDRYIYHIDPGPGLYNTGMRVEPHPMQMIGSLIDVYA
jgi:hypothetical protein